MDTMVLKTQQYLNAMYGGNAGYKSVTEDGLTGWSTIYALTRALQIELGLSSTSDNFGKATKKAFNQLYPNGIVQQSANDTKTSRVYAIIQGALWCKGYSTGASGITEHFYGGTGSAVISLKEDAGLENPDSTVTLNVMKGLLSMDQYKLVSSGHATIRSIQQQLNQKYEGNIGLIPCDGLYGREMNKALIIVLQAILGLSADGVFGDGTKAACPTLPDDIETLSADVAEELVFLVRYALYCNGYDVSIYTIGWTSLLEAYVRNFQNDLKLTVTGKADVDTWMSLLLSKGNSDRSCTACDTRFEITSSRAAELKSKGYNIVGRYLTGTKYKVLRDDEAQRILDNGLYFFPIFQESSNHVSYFTKYRGKLDARNAVKAARKFGIPEGNVIYFAVDLDATSPQITNYVLPYFKALSESIDPLFVVGVYGTRNVCTQVCESGYAETCFVSDMSTGYSGNMGFKIPSNWNYDQYAEIDMETTTDGAWAIDKDAYSGRYEPVTELGYIYVQPSKPNIPASPTITSVLPMIVKLETLYTEWYTQHYATEENPDPYLSPRGLAAGITNFMRSIAYTAFYWTIGLLSDINNDFVTYVQQKSQEEGDYYNLYSDLSVYMRDDSSQVLISDGNNGLIDLKHLAATIEAYIDIILVQKNWVGWAGDLASSMDDTTKHLNKDGGACQSVADSLVGCSGTRFSYEDMCGDADAVKIAELILASKSSAHSFSEAFSTYYANYVGNRFMYIVEDLGCTEYLPAIKEAVKNVMVERGDLIVLYFGKNPTEEVIDACCNAFSNYIYREL